MSDQAYLLVQVWLVIMLSVFDGAEVLVQHPEWFQ
jgi:hypothetical protein